MNSANRVLKRWHFLDWDVSCSRNHLPLPLQTQTERNFRDILACTKNGTFSAYYGEREKEGGRAALRRIRAAAAVIIEAPGRSAAGPTDRTFRRTDGKSFRRPSVNGGLLFQLSEKPQSLSVGGENAYRASLESTLLGTWKSVGVSDSCSIRWFPVFTGPV